MQKTTFCFWWNFTSTKQNV